MPRAIGKAEEPDAGKLHVRNFCEGRREVLHYLDDGTVSGEYTEELDNAVQQLINNEERGQEYMLMMTYVAERESTAEYRKLVKLVRRWNNRTKKDSAEGTAETIGITLSTFENILSLINKHPDWDDEQIVDEADWELLDD